MVNEKCCHEVGVGKKKQRVVEVRRSRHLTTFYREPNLSRRILAILDRDKSQGQHWNGNGGKGRPNIALVQSSMVYAWVCCHRTLAKSLSRVFCMALKAAEIEARAHTLRNPARFLMGG